MHTVCSNYSTHTHTQFTRWGRLWRKLVLNRKWEAGWEVQTEQKQRLDLLTYMLDTLFWRKTHESGEPVLTRSQPGQKEAGRTGGRISWLAHLKTHNKPLRETDTWYCWTTYDMSVILISKYSVCLLCQHLTRDVAEDGGEAVELLVMFPPLLWSDGPHTGCAWTEHRDTNPWRLKFPLKWQWNRILIPSCRLKLK